MKISDSITRDTILENNPGLARSFLKGSRTAGVILACLECMGGSRSEARKCETTDCFLWPFGLAGRKSAQAEKLGKPEDTAPKRGAPVAALAALAKRRAEQKSKEATEAGVEADLVEDDDIPI